jgi:hypothetical protein
MLLHLLHTTLRKLWLYCLQFILKYFLFLIRYNIKLIKNIEAKIFYQSLYSLSLLYIYKMIYLFLTGKCAYYKSLKPSKPRLYIFLCLRFIYFIIRHPLILQIFFKGYIKSRYSFRILFSFNLLILHMPLYQIISQARLYLYARIPKTRVLVYNRANFISFAAPTKYRYKYDIKKRRFSGPINTEYSVKTVEALKINDIVFSIAKYVTKI